MKARNFFIKISILFVFKKMKFSKLNKFIMIQSTKKLKLEKITFIDLQLFKEKAKGSFLSKKDRRKKNVFFANIFF